MPKKDGTGPEGKGSKTGRGVGNCPKPPSWSKYEKDKKSTERPKDGRGKGEGRGPGRK